MLRRREREEQIRQVALGVDEDRGDAVDRGLIQHGGLLNTGDAAEGRAFFDHGVLPFDVLVLVVNEWDAGVATLLGAPMDKSILADMEEPRAREKQLSERRFGPYR
jgi:hypothetical protein